MTAKRCAPQMTIVLPKRCQCRHTNLNDEVGVEDEEEEERGRRRAGKGGEDGTLRKGALCPGRILAALRCSRPHKCGGAPRSIPFYNATRQKSRSRRRRRKAIVNAPRQPCWTSTPNHHGGRGSCGGGLRAHVERRGEGVGGRRPSVPHDGNDIFGCVAEAWFFKQSWQKKSCWLSGARPPHACAASLGQLQACRASTHPGILPHVGGCSRHVTVGPVPMSNTSAKV